MQWCSFLGVHNLVRVLLQDISDLIRLSRTVQHTYFIIYELCFTCFKVKQECERSYIFQSSSIYTGKPVAVWANGSQECEISPRSRFYHLHKSRQIGSIYRKTEAKSILETGINTNLRLEHSVRESRTNFSDVLLLPKIFRWNDPKRRVPFTLQPDFPET